MTEARADTEAAVPATRVEAGKAGALPTRPAIKDKANHAAMPTA